MKRSGKCNENNSLCASLNVLYIFTITDSSYLFFPSFLNRQSKSLVSRFGTKAVFFFFNLMRQSQDFLEKKKNEQSQENKNTIKR